MGRLRVRATAMRPEVAVPATEAALRGPVVPWLDTTRDTAFPIILSLSFIVHATVLLPSLLKSDRGSPPVPREIAVEIVQAPPKPIVKPVPKPSPPKPLPPKTPPAKPAPAKSPPVKPLPPKPLPPKPLAPKPLAPKQETPKPERQKSAPKPQPKPPPKAPVPKPSPQGRAEKPSPTAAPSPAAQDVAARLKSLLGPMPVVALPGVSGDGTEEVSYSQLVLSKVAKAKKEGRYRGVPGAASVAFTVGDAGEVAKVEIVRPSGDPALDAEAIAMINRGAPYPVPPPGARRDYTITLRFEPLI